MYSDGHAHRAELGVGGGRGSGALEVARVERAWLREPDLFPNFMHFYCIVELDRWIVELCLWLFNYLRIVIIDVLCLWKRDGLYIVMIRELSKHD